MTFEEFFTKKRIDLTLLRRANPALYEEFRDHYAEMSEKSFDHTKKYWFNRLRKDFLLEVVEAPKAEAVKAATPEGGTKVPPVAGATATKPAGFKPRFKPNMAKSTASPSMSGPPEKVPEDSKPPVPGTKPTGFKPRFKAGVTPPAAQKPENDEKTAQESHELTPVPDPAPVVSKAATPKPLGFKPRFKAGKTTNKGQDDQ